METGRKGRRELTVSAPCTAKAMGSGELEVLATPCLIALLEETAWRSIAEDLEEGQGTVGTKLTFSHTAPTPVGMKVWCETELVEIDRRRLVFSVEAYDEAGKIGEGTHERFLIDNEAFLEKALAKASAKKNGEA